ncbi:hypothetical protein [Actinopolymorpha alba]|nr:hypothetical protein [Actinopolymorpha alba]
MTDEVDIVIIGGGSTGAVPGVVPGVVPANPAQHGPRQARLEGRSDSG